MKVSATTFVEIDNFCDYVPFVSTVSVIVDLFLKYVVVPNLAIETVRNSRYWSHIKHKDLFRCIQLLVPVFGNLSVMIIDYLIYQRDVTVNLPRAISSNAFAIAILAQLAGGVNVNAEDVMPAPTKDEKALIEAVCGDDIATARQLLEKGISPNFYHSGHVPLVDACQYSTDEMVNLLIAFGANVNTPDRFGSSPIAAACSSGNLLKVGGLLPLIQDINAANAKGVTPLMQAVINKHTNVVAVLMSAGANPNIKLSDESDAVALAIVEDKADMLPFLIDANEDINLRKYQFRPPTLNVFDSIFGTIRDLTPLHYATLKGSQNSALYLLDRSNVQAIDSFHNTPLHYSVDKIDVLRGILTKCSAPEFINFKNSSGSTALHRAIDQGHADSALQLLQSGADPFIVDNEGNSSLISACKKGLTDVIAYIEQHQKIDDEVREKMAEEQKAFEAAKGQPVEEKTSLVDATFELAQTGLNVLQNALKDRVKEAQRGPMPRTGMELFFGKLDWPV